MSASIAVLGSGSWGTALAILLARNGNEVGLWGRNTQKLEKYAAAGENSDYLPGITFPDTLQINTTLESTLDNKAHVLIVVPSMGFRDVLKQAKPLLSKEIQVAWASKGFEPDTFLPMHKMVEQELGSSHGATVISGPTFAGEVVRGLPTAVTVASEQEEHANTWAELLHNEMFRAYTSDDVVGVETGGAVKNVLAIASGIADGLHFGANTRAALITRGLAEIQRLGVALGGKPETFMGLAGLGDLVLTCTDNQSRNRRLGLALAAGKSATQACDEIGQVAEGFYAAKEVLGLAKQLQVDMPIAQQVYQVLYENKSPKQAVHSLLSRSIKAETHG